MLLKSVSQTIHQLDRDRLMTGLIIAFGVLTVLFCVYVGVSLHGSDVQIATRYTAFGDTNYYRSHWYYLICFAVFGLLNLAINVAVAVKLFVADQTALARSWVLFAAGILLIGVLIVHSVLGIAYL